MYHVVVATSNPAKISAILQAFEDVFGVNQCQISAADTDSGVRAQPISDTETLTGARQRVANARNRQPDADFWVAIEAGIDGAHAFAWIVIENTSQRGESRSASFLLPPAVSEQLQHGRELGEIMAELTGIENIKHKGGALGVLTEGRLTRTSVYHQALLLALCPLQHPYYR
ncbi:MULTISPECIES: inosine/xanthosine triphosphatase [Tatumella]|uniref:Inosine/xanthosine triphosphatase n=1 Tax=Tatumella punctata TaxID=399969 RepID=A0ABW1VII2_9GAMM|nr:MULTISPECIES: inosine/xanthosine triphosphatase [unclassified Tatumella]MBS0855269.1 inosine/xanthosine triphosphatase [Tatumella sp. JGM16]MBS0892831.1 inosine/xanthosine triphosphatase [Tatumella sp. JGM130]MBS0911826.1 inosine/xanthosine triphosphatase [Tatumella sp. JGM91]